MYCSKCGTQAAEGAEFCSKCGTQLTTGTPADPSPAQQQPDTLTIDGRIYRRSSALQGSKYEGLYSHKGKWYRIEDGTKPVFVPMGAWQTTHWAVRAVIIASVVIVGVFFAALINDDANYLVRTFTGFDVRAASSTASSSTGSSISTINTVSLRGSCASDDCDIRVSNSSGARDNYESTPSRTWNLRVSDDYEVYSISVRDNNGGAASCTARGFGETDTQQSGNSSVRCSVTPGF